MDVDRIIGKINPRYADKKGGPLPAWEHKIVYDSTSDQLEPVYFWLIDFLQDLLGYKDFEKLEDSFAASPGGGYFSEIGAKATKMQEEGMKIMATVNTIIRTIINLLYDLKDFEIRLAQYDQANNKDKNLANAGELALKNIWLDKVDMPQKGRGSIHQMTYEMGFTTLRDAFYAVRSVQDVDKMDINDRVKRVLKPRLAEFLEWRKRSEQELRKRFDIERAYLKSEVAALKLYTRWAKPYLRIAEELGMKAGGFGKDGRIKDARIINAFNTIVLELKVMAKKEFNPKKMASIDIQDTDISPNWKYKKFKRKWYGCILLDFKFRGLPFRTPQGHYVFGGRVEVSLKAYSLNQDELDVLEKEIDKDDIYTALNLVEEATDKSLKSMQEDLDHFLKEEKSENKKSKENEGTKFEIGTIPKDNFKEQMIRRVIEKKVSANCFKLYDVYKKAHGMASFMEPDWETEEIQTGIYNPEFKG